MKRFNNPITATESFHRLDVYFSLEHIKCTSDEKWRIIPDFSRYQASTSGPVSYTHLTLPTNREV